MAYSPAQPPGGTDVEQLADWVYAELAKVQRTFNVQDLLQLKTFNAVPGKVNDGMIVKADGTHWNPGSGAGIYAYYGGTWNKL